MPASQAVLHATPLQVQGQSNPNEWHSPRAQMLAKYLRIQEQILAALELSCGIEQCLGYLLVMRLHTSIWGVCVLGRVAPSC